MVVAITVGFIISAPVYSGPVSDHFNGKTFINPENIKPRGLPDVLRWGFNRERGPWKKNYSITPGPKPEREIQNGIRVTYINHTTFLLQTLGLNVLTDPVYSFRVSPFTFAGPKRMRPPGISFEDLPKIDLVLLSHNHYDHLDIDTVKKIKDRFDPTFVVPLGVSAFLKQHNITKIIELDWWQQATFESLTITGTPAQHFSGRGFFDRDKTLWCGYSITSSAGSIYFAGDTGYNEKSFKEIGTRLGPVDVALIPIGAYKPAWFMWPVHCSPEGAVKIHLDIKAKKSIGSHFGTFPLGDEGQQDPLDDLAIAKREHHVPAENFITLKEGESTDFNQR